MQLRDQAPLLRHESKADEAYVIEAKGLAKTYKDVVALRSLDLRIPKNVICGFLGPNGSGKSTAIKLLLGLAQPTSGSGTIFGFDIAKDSLAIRQRVGYLAQEPRFYEDLTARETLHFVARFFYKGPLSTISRRVSESLELVGLSDRADRPIKGFSGGERQRLGIAQAQINHPDVLILDEPGASLDPLGRRDVLEIMQCLRQNTTIFYATHLLDDVQRVSDMVVIMKQGETVMQAPLEVLMRTQSGTAFEVVLHGETQEAYARLRKQPWVKAIDILSNTPETWLVTVSDEKEARAHLLLLITEDGQVEVSQFGHKQQTLESIFIDIMEGQHHESK